MADNPLKEKVAAFIRRGENIGVTEYHAAGALFSFSYIAGPLYDAWMGEISIFNERHLKDHPLHDSIATACSQHNRIPSSYYKDMMGYLRALYTDAEFFATVPVLSQNNSEKSIMSNEVFVVHGHDEEAKQAVARTLEKLGFKAIILHEQPNNGRTIIEKFEDYADVDYAVILYTECDVGRDKEMPVESERYRARQNVVFEHGFFIGKLGRDHVFALVKGDVETPGDISGIVYTPMDCNEAWVVNLAKDMKSAGLPVDLNKLI